MTTYKTKSGNRWKRKAGDVIETEKWDASSVSPCGPSLLFSVLLSVPSRLACVGSSKGSRVLGLPSGFGNLDDQREVPERKDSEVKVIIARL